MTRVLKIVSFLGIGLVLFLGLILFAVYHLIQVGELRRFLISEVEKRTPFRVRVGEASVEMGTVVGISFRDFALMEPDNDRPVATAQRVLIRLALRPLLERKVVFYEMRFYRPTLQVVRDESGKIPLLDFVLNLPFQQQREVQFALDLREIKAEKGEVTFLVRRREQTSKVTHLREIDLTLRRLQKEEMVRLGSEGSLKVAGQREMGPALEFGLKTVVQEDVKSARLMSNGKIVFPKDALELQQARFRVDTQVEALPADLFWNYSVPLPPVRGIHGTLGSRIRWEGSLKDRVQVTGEIQFKGIEIDAPDIFPGVLAPGDGRLELKMDLTPREIRLQQMDMYSKEISLAMGGSIRSLGEEDPDLEMRLTTPFLPLLTAGRYIPLKVLKAAHWEHLLKAVTHGELRFSGARVAGRLSQIRRLLEPGFENHVWLDVEVREVGGNLIGDRYLPVRGLTGQIVLDQGVLYYKGFKGTYGLSRFAEIEGRHKGFLTDQSLLELRARGEVDLSQFQEQVKLGLLPAPAAKAVSLLRDLGGKGRFGISLRKDLNSAYQYEGQLSLDNARLGIGEALLSQVKGELSFSPKEIRAEGIAALLAGSPIYLKAVLRNYLDEKPTFDLTADSPGINAGQLLRILLSMGSAQDPGTIRGTIRYQGSLTSAENRKLTGSLELIGVYLPLKFFSRPLREVRGRVRLDGRGVDLQGLKGQLAGHGVDFSGRWSSLEEPQLTFSFSSPEMDVAYLLPQDESRGDDWYDHFQARGTISIDRGRYEGFEFSDLKTDLTLDRRVWRLENFFARSSGGVVQGRGIFIDSPDGLRISVEPRIQGVPVKGLLSWFDIGTTEMTGKVNLSGNLDISGRTGAERKRNLNGGFQLRIEDGVARRFGLLVQILSFLDLSRWFSLRMPDINQEGVRFRSVTGDFKVSRGIYSTQNLFVDSDDLRITGAGELDGPKGEVDFVIALRPFPGVDSAVNFIPLIGQGLAAIKNSLLVASFRVKGPVDNPTITPAPLSTLSEFFYGALAIPRGLIGSPGAEKK